MRIFGLSRASIDTGVFATIPPAVNFASLEVDGEIEFLNLSMER